MANHGFVTTRRILTPEAVNEDIREIVARRLKDEVTIEFRTLSALPKKTAHEGYESWDIWALWHFEPKKSPTIKEPWHYGFEAWQMSHRKLEFRHPHGEWAWWAQMIIQEELAYKYDGTVSDEGVEERWKITPQILRKYQHYRDWVTKRWPRQTVAQKAARAVMARIELMYVPEPLRSL